MDLCMRTKMPVRSMVTCKLEQLKTWVDPGEIPGLSNENFSLDYETDDALYIVKPEVGYSIMNSLFEPQQCEAEEEAVEKLRRLAVHEALQAKCYAQENANPVYQNLLSCLEDSNFTGIILCNLNVRLNSPELLGPGIFVRQFSYRIPFLKIENAEFFAHHAEVKNGVVKGWLESSESAYTWREQEFSLTVRNIFAFLDGEQIVNPGIRMELSLYTLFGMEAYAKESLFFQGLYTRISSGSGEVDAYHLLMVSAGILEFQDSWLCRVRLEKAETGLIENGDRMSFQVSLEGKLFFRDPASGFCPVDCMRFRHLRIELELTEQIGTRMDHYRNIRFPMRQDFLGEKSVLGQLPYHSIQLVSWEDGEWPESLGFSRMQVPISQSLWKKAKGTRWFGVVAGIEFFHGISLDVLFAFSGQEPFYAGARFGMGTGGRELPISSLLSLSASEAAILQEEGGSVRLILKGIKASLLGIRIPEGSLNLAIIPHKEKECSWYCVYGKGEKEGDI